MTTFFHSGCLGDIIYALPSIQALGGGHLYYNNRPWTAPLLPKVYNVLPLLASQKCISGVSHGNASQPYHDFSTFRFGGQKYGEPIIHRQARWVRAKINISEPWLKVTPRSEYPIVVARCPRWVGFAMPWRQLVSTFSSQMMFVGLKTEYESFTEQFGKISYYTTQNLLQTAEVIAGCDLFIGNQSSPLAIAEGLHKRTIVEVCAWAPDCLNFRPENTHVIDGSLSFMFDGQYFVSQSLVAGLDDQQVELIDRAKLTYRKLFVKHLLA